METSKSHRKTNEQDGFALIEVMIAILILAIGLLGLAALMAQLTGTTGNSRYMGTEVMLASEKLEDLNRLQIGDPALAAGGNLAADAANYSDQIQVSSDNGSTTTVAAGTAAASTDMLQFRRRWVIENSPAVFPAGVIRITVFVALLDGNAVSRANTFQTSMVRQ
ncbi:MAG TPA: prepilin-type N-terminal cleavage/methylation domain-containing protein [Candidatus Angelobacter sp.]|jgi:type IV pilus assembly protein PilV|nr:prepilin-type N-terminal cleavage/methylation domain-containing protein [Candidatus Angelobacter sp.]